MSRNAALGIDEDDGRTNTTAAVTMVVTNIPAPLNFNLEEEVLNFNTTFLEYAFY